MIEFGPSFLAWVLGDLEYVGYGGASLSGIFLMVILIIAAWSVHYFFSYSVGVKRLAVIVLCFAPLSLLANPYAYDSYLDEPIPGHSFPWILVIIAAVIVACVVFFLLAAVRFVPASLICVISLAAFVATAFWAHGAIKKSRRYEGTNYKELSATPININKANQKTLERIPGVGRATAKLIIANRPFERVIDVSSLPGIRPENWEMMKDCMSVGLHPPPD
jgi:hypothetical protein